MWRSLFIAVFCASVWAAEKAEPRTATAYEAIVIEGREAQRKGLLGKAVEAFDKAIKLEPNKVPAHYFKAEILAAQRKSQEAIAEFSKVIELDAKASSAYQGRAEEEFKLG